MIKKRKEILILIGVLCLICLVFRQWLFPGLITGGDWWPYSPAMIRGLDAYPFLWYSQQNSGLGGNVGPSLPITMIFALPSVIAQLFSIAGWAVIERIFFLFPLLIGLIISVFF